MTPKLPSLSVPDLARVVGNTPDEAAEWLIHYSNEPGGSFNYIKGMRSIKAAYSGLHRLDQLLLACEGERTELGRKSNKDLVFEVAPGAFGRTTQVFDLSARKFSYGRRQAGFRVPFFFVENSVVNICFIWPRKGTNLTATQIGMIATIMKIYLLDTEFYGLPSDIEFIEASAPIGTKQRVVDRFNLSSINLWDHDMLTSRLTTISNALDIVEASNRVKPRRRKEKSTIIDMPLFD
ncbi:hypothetical protein [Methylorubrum sp. SB2]|uniref:hypothetical protein n=1 Tax=Methylorubrum subtropicum TaxID=3138812 RepID=UPI00313ABD28